jgi:SAM-dependent methyltransferase
MLRGLLIFLINTFFSIYFSFFSKPKLNQSLKKTLDLYAKGGFEEKFNFIRLWDAPYKQIEKLIPQKGIVVDLGSGDGLLANYLGVSSTKRKVFGIELNKKRFNQTPKVLRNTEFVNGDILKAKYPEADAILLVHVLHHLNSFKSQEEMIKNIKTKLKKNGKLIIVEIIYTPLHKFILTALVDYFVLPILFEGKLISSRIHYRNTKNWQKTLKSLGFKTTVRPIHKGMPFSHVIITAQI